jgi:uncharacterized coiled-coil DUF342 family protein
MESNLEPVTPATDALYHELEELKTVIATKKSEVTELRKKIDETVKSRDGFNAEVRKASEEIRQLKPKRDSLNTRVRELKQKRDELQKAASQKREALAALLEQARKSSEQLQGSMSELSKQIKRLEWYIQTNPLAPKTERNIVGKIGILEASLVKHKELKNVRDKLLQLRVEVGALRMQAQATHDELTKLAKESEKVHMAMQESVKVLSQNKKEADAKHTLFLEQSKSRHEAIIALKTSLLRAEKIRSEIGEIQVSSTAEKAEKIKSKHKEAASEKLRSTGRLSLEEFQALMGDSASDSDEE